MQILSLIKSKVLEIGLVLLGVLALIFLGKKQEEQKQKIEKLKDKADTLERINEVPVSTDRDRSLDRLRKSGRVRD